MDDVGELAEAAFEAMLAAHPIGATMLGIRDHDHEVPDLSEDAEDARIEELAGFERRADALLGGALDEQDRVTLEVLRFESRAERELLECRLEEFNVSPLIGPHATVLNTVPKITLTEPEHAEAYLERISELERYLEQAAERLRSGVRRGRTPVARNVARSIGHLDSYLASENDPLVDIDAPQDWAGARTWRTRVEDVVSHRVRPVLLRYRGVLEDEVLPHARDQEACGVCHLDGGAEVYRRSIVQNTTTERDPDEIHELGLDLVDQLRAEYADVGRRAMGISDPDEVMGRIREDPDLRFGDAGTMVRRATQALERADAAAPDWFGRLPSAPCEVRVIPEHEAPTAPPAYYMPPAHDGSRPGVYWQNTHEPAERTTVELEAIAFHEAVPGHHFQIALAQELDLPRIRRFSLVTAYVEGWGLYAERLADEMGLYRDDISRLGMLVTDSMRACRLVIDTGIHHRRWDRDRAVAYFRDHSPMPAQDIESEVDRYIAWPGQALAYMIGRQEIQRLRERAQARLGDGFDVRDFHDVVLLGGALPLEVLAASVERWLDGG